jgi:hypothetical protein
MRNKGSKPAGLPYLAGLTIKISCDVMLLVEPPLKAVARNIVGLDNCSGFSYRASEAVGTVPSSV